MHLCSLLTGFGALGKTVLPVSEACAPVTRFWCGHHEVSRVMILCYELHVVTKVYAKLALILQTKNRKRTICK